MTKGLGIRKRMRKNSRCNPLRVSGRFSLPRGLGWVWPSLILVLLVLGLASAGGSLGVAATLSSATRPQPIPPSLLNPTSVLADFDNDNRPDLAIIRSEGSHYKVDIQLSTQESVSYSVPRSASGIRLMVCDVDGDDYDDLILFNGT